MENLSFPFLTNFLFFIFFFTDICKSRTDAQLRGSAVPSTPSPAPDRGAKRCVWGRLGSIQLP